MPSTSCLLGIAIRLIVILRSHYVAVVHLRNIAGVSKMCYQSSLNKWQCKLLPLHNLVHLVHCFYWLWGLLGDTERHDFIPSFCEYQWTDSEVEVSGHTYI